MTARIGVSIVPSTSELVMSAPSQCVKWMISDAAMPGKEILGAAGESDDLVRKDRTADEHVVVLDDQTVEGDRHVLVQPAERELRDHRRRDRAERGKRGRVVPAVVENPPIAGAAVNDRAPEVPTQLLVAHRRVRAEGDEKVERRHARRELALEDVEHQRHRHRACAVGNEDDDALAVERQAAESLPRQVRHFFRREMAFDDAAADDAHDP